jgi:hypothetical protein
MVNLKAMGSRNFYGIFINRMMEASPALDIGKSITIQQAHELFGHVSEDATKNGKNLRYQSDWNYMAM